jgi:hypothetical protein
MKGNSVRARSSVLRCSPIAIRSERPLPGLVPTQNVEGPAIGEYASDGLHVSRAIAPDPRSGLMLYSALIVLTPGLGNG